MNGPMRHHPNPQQTEQIADLKRQLSDSIVREQEIDRELGDCRRQLEGKKQARLWHHEQELEAKRKLYNLHAHADALAAALEKLAMPRHYHEATEGSDECGKCGYDLRNLIHYRQGESYVTDCNEAKSILKAYRQFKEPGE